MSYQTTDQRWFAALQADVLTPVTTAFFYSGYDSNIPIGSAPVTAGQISFDTTASVLRQASNVTMVNIPSEGLNVIPGAAGDLTFPDGTEMQVYRGYVLPDGSSLSFPTGRLLMENVVVYDTGLNLYVTSDGYDRMESLSRNEFTQAYTTVPTSSLVAAITNSTGMCVVEPAFPLTVPVEQQYIISVDSEMMLVTSTNAANGYMTVQASGRGYAGTTPATHAVNALIQTTADVTIGGIVQNRLPGVPMNLTPSTSVLTPTPFNIGDDPSQLVQSLALAATAVVGGDSIGMECYFDRQGVFNLVPIVDPTTQVSVYDYVEGPGNIATIIQRTLTNKGVPNWIILVSQGSNIPTPIRADWQDNNPASPTYIGSPTYSTDPPGGVYPTTVQSVTTTLAATQAQAQAMVNALGQAAFGQFDQIQLSTMGDPALDPLDVFTVTRGASKLSNAAYVAVKGTLDLSVTTRSTLTGYRVN